MNEPTSIEGSLIYYLCGNLYSRTLMMTDMIWTRIERQKAVKHYQFYSILVITDFSRNENEIEEMICLPEHFEI